MIAGGRIYDIAENVDASGHAAPGLTLIALDALTGTVVWREATPRNEISMAYDQGHIYLQSLDAYITALDAGTGAQLWTASMNHNTTGVYHSIAPPVAANGVVAAMANDSLMTFDGASGNLLHDTVLRNGNTSGSPAIDGSNVFVTDGCGDYSVSLATGNVAWSHEPGCTGGGGGTAMVASGKVYAYDTSSIFDEATGTVVGSMPFTDEPIAVDAGWVFSITSDPPGFGAAADVVRAIDPTGATAWTFFGDGYLMPPVVVANHVVYAASQSGLVYLLDEATGHELFHVFAGDQVIGQNERSPYPFWSMAIGEGLLAVPTASGLTVFAQAPSGTVPTNLPAQQPPGGGYYVSELPIPQGPVMASVPYSIAGPYVAGRLDYQTVNGPVPHPVIWAQSGSVDWTNRLPPGAVSAFMSGVNSSGLATGTYQYLANGGQSSAGFVTTPSGMINQLPGATVGAGINSSGTVAGSFVAGGCDHAATWANGVETQLPMNGQCGDAEAINDSGDVAGWAGWTNGAVWWKGGTLHNLGHIGGCWSLALGIGPDDTAVGYSDVTTCGAQRHAVMWKNDVATDLGTAGGVQAQADAISAQDQPVGFAEDAFGDQWAVIWKSGQAIALGSMIDPRFGWFLASASGIDSSGRIVGSGFRYGEIRGFVLTPVPSRGANQAPTVPAPPRSPVTTTSPSIPGPRASISNLRQTTASAPKQQVRLIPDVDLLRLMPIRDRPRPF